MQVSRLAKKVDAANKIVSCNNKISYYKQAIEKIKNKSSFEAELQVRILRTKNNIWVSLSTDEVLYILNRKLKEQESFLSTF